VKVSEEKEIRPSLMVFPTGHRSISGYPVYSLRQLARLLQCESVIAACHQFGIFRSAFPAVRKIVYVS
jgi:hypothetical protein